MSVFKNLQKSIKTHHFIAFLGLIVLGYAVMQYSNKKGILSDGFNGGATNQVNTYESNNMPPQNVGFAQPAEPAGQNEKYASVSGISTSSQGLPPSCIKGGNVADPSELLPKDNNSQWAQLNPAGANDFKDVNLLKSGYHIGVDTVGSSLRNANLQVRSEPPNPVSVVSPWMNSTIEPDLMRMPLEIGRGPQ
jgi:hypothetical protein